MILEKVHYWYLYDSLPSVSSSARFSTCDDNCDRECGFAILNLVLCTREPALEHGITICLDRGTGTRTWSKRAEKLAEKLHRWKTFLLAGTRKLG